MIRNSFRHIEMHKENIDFKAEQQEKDTSSDLFVPFSGVLLLFGDLQ